MHVSSASRMTSYSTSCQPTRQLLDHDLADRAGPEAGPDALAVGGLGLDDPAAGAAEREGRPDDRRQADRRRGPRRRRRRGRSAWRPRRCTTARRAGRSGRGGRGRPRGPRPSGSPRAACRAASRRSVSSTPARARSMARFRPVWPPSPASRPSGRSRAMTASIGLDGERLEVDGVGDVGVGHDRGRVGVDEDRPDALGAERAAGLRAGVVELGGLADDDGPGADDQDRGGLRPGAASRHAMRPSRAGPQRRRRTGRRRPARRAGPARPRGGTGPSRSAARRWRRPSTEPSLRLTWLTRKPRRRRAASRRRPGPRGSGP